MSDSSNPQAQQTPPPVPRVPRKKPEQEDHMFEQDGSASSTKRESLTSHITGTINDLTDSISQARSQRRKASLPPRIAPKVDEASELHIYEKSSPLHNPVSFGFLTTVGVGLALLAYYAFTNVGALVGWVTGAIFIALGLDPIVRKLESFGVKRGAGVVIVVLSFAAIISGLVVWIVPIISAQASSFVYRAPAIYQDFIDSDTFKRIDDVLHVNDWVNNNVPKFLESLTSSSAVGGFMSNLITAGSTIAQILTGTIIVLFLSLYFLSSMRTIKAWGSRLAPASKRERVEELTERITGAVGNYVMGQGVVAVLNATFALITMIILGFSFPQLVAVFVLILAFIPLVGGVAALVLVSLILLTQGWQMSVTFAIAYFIYLQIEAYIISPRIMSKAVSVPGGVAIIAVAAGGALWGVLGALIAIPVAASLLILVKEVFIPRQDHR
jgi:hypothetical protein